MGDEKEVQEKRKLSLDKKNQLYIAIFGFILTVVGISGTFYQILGFKIVWIILLVLGFAILLAILLFYKGGKTEEQKESIKHLEEIIQRTGINQVYKNQKDAEDQIIEECNRSKTVKILAVRAQHLLGSKHSLFRREDNKLTFRLQRGEVSMQILLLDPNGKYVDIRSSEVGEDSERFVDMINNTIKIIKEFKGKSYAVEYRLYDMLPTFRLFIFENKLFLSFFLEKIDGQDTLMYEIGSSSQIYCAYDRFFDDMFEPKQKKSEEKRLDDF